MSKQEEIDTIQLNGVGYIRKDRVTMQPAVNTDGLEYVVTRSRNAGVHVGYLKSHENQNVTLTQSRRIWSWVGAATLSQLAMEGVKDKDSCKFSMAVNEIRLTGVCEVIPCTEAAKSNIAEVPEWKE